MCCVLCYGCVVSHTIFVVLHTIFVVSHTIFVVLQVYCIHSTSVIHVHVNIAIINYGVKCYCGCWLIYVYIVLMKHSEPMFILYVVQIMYQCGIGSGLTGSTYTSST